MTRAELIKELKKVGVGGLGRIHILMAVDKYIESDRRRICAPLIELYKEGYFVGTKAKNSYLEEAIERVLQLAGISEEL